MPTHNFIDLTDKIFGRLYVVERIKNTQNKQIYWKCKCICGTITIVRGNRLTSGATQSCGCLNKEITAKRSTTHGMAYTPEYAIWSSIIQRCTNPNGAHFKNYGGRGITVCEEWQYSFMAFFDHVGKRPTSEHSIDRKNNEGNYEPGNIHWATKQEQHNNTRRNHKITVHGCTMTLAQWAHSTGINYRTLITRVNKLGWSPQKAIFQDVRHKSKPNLSAIISTSPSS